jgi:hypothetical protein
MTLIQANGREVHPVFSIAADAELWTRLRIDVISHPWADRTHHSPCFHPVRRRPTHRGAGVVHGVQVERATVRTTWTPWTASARLRLGRRWTGWKLPAHAPTNPQSATAPPPSRCRPVPRRRHRLDPGPRSAVIDSWPPALSTCGRASAQRARSGPEAGAQRAAEPGSAPGGAERSRVP